MIFKHGARINQKNYVLNLTRRLAARHHPKRIFVTNTWLGHYCNVPMNSHQTNVACDMEAIDKYLP